MVGHDVGIQIVYSGSELQVARERDLASLYRMLSPGSVKRRDTEDDAAEPTKPHDPGLPGGSPFA